MPDPSKITIFVSYAHEDKPYADVLFKELEKHSKSSNIKNIQWKTWVDVKDIFIGDQWRESIQVNVKTCDFALLLVSPDYLASDFIKIEEFNRFLERAKNENFIFFPILLRHCNFSQWEELAKRQFFMPAGADYGFPDLKNIAYADLVKFRESDGFPLPNSNLDRYHMELIDALENSIAAHLDVSMPDKEVESIHAGLKKGSRAYYDLLRGPNGRFRYLKISDILFTGAETKWLETNVDIDNNEKLLQGGEGGGFLEKSPPTIFEVLPILWKSNVKHAVIVGEGGMGKTVSLIQWWKNLLGSEEKLKPVPVPVFIALNEFNQVSEARREGFILETIRKNYGLSKITLEQIETFMKTPLQQGEGFIPSMVLLLDGFNEITAEKRQLLIELNHLAEQYPGLQVIMTSRFDMRGNFNWSHWRPVRLKELEDDRVDRYLQEHAAAGTVVPGTRRLRKLIKNPMMLTLYAASCEVQEKHRDSRYCSFKDRVDSPGELLWNFIEAQVALLPEKVGPGEDRVFYYWFLLKYLLPGLGFEMEKAGLFAFTYSQFRNHLDRLCLRYSQGEFLDTVPQLDNYLDILPVGEGADEKESRKRAARLREIFCGEMHMLVEEGETLRFLHQGFRDFFAAVHLLNEAEISTSKVEISGIFKNRILDYFVRRMLGEIEGEHRSKPYLVKDVGWKIDINKENRLYKVLDLCRGKFGKEVGFAVWNIVSVWKEVREELSGADLYGLDLSGIPLNGVRCSRVYEDRYLAAVFAGSRIHEKDIFPQGHSTSVNSAVYSTDGKKILSASNDNTIKEWDAGTGECVKTLAGHHYDVISAVYSGDGKKILSASSDHTIKEWDAETGECVKTLAGHTSFVTSAVYSPDGKKILSASWDKTIKEWDAGTGECVKTLAGDTSWVFSAVYSPDGKKILSASLDDTVKEWDIGTGECLKILAGHTSTVTSAVYSRDGRKILSSSEDGTIKEWDEGTGQCVKNLTGHMDKARSAVYSPDGKRILSASEDNTIKEWDAGTGICVKTMAGHSATIWQSVYSPYGNKILFTSWDGTIKEWDAETGLCLKTFTGHSDLVLSAVYSPDGKKIISYSRDGTIKEWDAGTCECVKTLVGHRVDLGGVVYSPDGGKILYSSRDGTIKECDAGTGECVKTLAGHKSEVRSAVYSKDGKKILSASWDKTIKEWDAGTGECLKTHNKDDHPDFSEYPTYKAIKKELKTVGNKIIVPAAPGEEKARELINISGLFIQGCSFRDLEKGSQWTREGLEILKMYGARL